MRQCILVLGLIAAVCIAGCKTTSGDRVLRFFFDGVPPRGAAKGVSAKPGSPEVLTPSVTLSQHGPFAAKLCSGCHVPQTNALVAPVGELCYNCHELQLTKKYIHGPLASGGCLVCHDPHSSPNRALLVADSTTFCIRCHDPGEVAKNPAHQNLNEQCTDCHDAHMSDDRYLLK
jgi:predicted CXXCH cytochrome family protein